MKLIFLIFLSNITFGMEIKDISVFYESFKKSALESKTLNKSYRYRLNNVKFQLVGTNQIDPYLVAECNHKENIVSINKDMFQTLPTNRQQQTIDHELGHCVLLRSHYNLSTYSSFGEKPDDIMHHTTFAYENELQIIKMRKELFKPIFYGTLLEVESKINNNEQTVINGTIKNDLSELRKVEHSVMQNRIEKYLKKTLPK